MATTMNLDEKDLAILTRRQAALQARPGVRVGDFVEFACGTVRRVSYVWPDESASIQTSDGGSYYLGDAGASMSGSLKPSVPASTLTDTGDYRWGDVWFFHHDAAMAHNGVNAQAAFRVFKCSRVAT